MKTQRAVGILHVSNKAVVNECILLAVATLLLLNSGCTFPRSESTRITSFRSHMTKRVDEVEVQSFLASRVALLRAGDHVTAFPTNDFILVSRDHLTAFPTNDSMLDPGEGFSGCATAIDERGYFLTSSYQAEEDIIYLIFRSDTAMSAERARVVWRGEPSKGQPGLAILHVPRRLDHVFEWATNCSVGDLVMAVGLSRSKTNFLGPEFLGGRIVEFGKPKGKPLHMDVIHTVPVQAGDGGGPFVAPDGRLIGINFEWRCDVCLRFLVLLSWEYSAVAVHPDLEWLSAVIEEDAAALSIEPGL